MFLIYIKGKKNLSKEYEHIIHIKVQVAEVITNNKMERDTHSSPTRFTKIKEFYNIKLYQTCGWTRYSYTVMEMYNPFERKI